MFVVKHLKACGEWLRFEELYFVSRYSNRLPFKLLSVRNPITVLRNKYCWLFLVE
jgi:hypothetical protein